MKHRWPTSLYSQIEAIFHSVRSIGKSKMDNDKGIRSFGSWEVYKAEIHRLAKFMHKKGRISFLDTMSVLDDMAEYLEERLAHYVEKKRSRQTMETILSALGKFEYAINHYIEIHALEIPSLDTESSV